MCLSHRLAGVLVILLLATCCYAQAPSPSVNPSPTASAASSNSQASATPAKPDSTTVKISTSGLELSGFPIWIIWVVIAVAVVIFLIWFYLLRSKNKKRDRLLLPTAVAAIISGLALTFLVGGWWGRKGAREELRDLIAARGTIEGPTTQTSPQLTAPPASQPTSRLTFQTTPQTTPQPSPQPSPQPTPQPSPQPSNIRTDNLPQGPTWPISTIVIGGFSFLFFIQMDILLYFYLRLRGRWDRPEK